MYLRRTFATVFVTTDDDAIDWHKHYVEGGGYTEHSLFAQALATHKYKNYRFPVPQGPKSSRPAGAKRSRRVAPKAKTSGALKRMLGPPCAEPRPTKSAAVGVASAGAVRFRAGALAGAEAGHDADGARDGDAGVSSGRRADLADAEGGAALGSDAGDDRDGERRGRAGPQNLRKASDARCCARTAAGQRCKRAADGGGFCAFHEKRSLTAQYAKREFEGLRAVLDSSRLGWLRARAMVREREDLAEAVRRSSEAGVDDGEEARARLYVRLAASGLVPIETAAEGDCQFIAIVATASLGVTARQLRKEVVQYLATFPQAFDGFWDGFGDFNEYLAYMRRQGSWGDHLTLTAVAHLTMRPIHVVTDRFAEESATMIVTPPDTIDPAAWGAPIYLAHHGELHYEGTQVLAALPPAPSGHHSGSSGGSSSSSSSSSTHPTPPAVSLMEAAGDVLVLGANGGIDHVAVRGSPCGRRPRH